MATPSKGGISGADLMRQFLPTSPYNRLLGISIGTIEPGMAQLALPFTQALVTNGTIVHGGAIASLIENAAAVAAWSDAVIPEKIRGVTISLMVTYLAMASQEDLQATARVLHRGRTLGSLDVEVTSASGSAIAKGLVTYKLG